MPAEDYHKIRRPFFLRHEFKRRGYVGLNHISVFTTYSEGGFFRSGMKYIFISNDGNTKLANELEYQRLCRDFLDDGWTDLKDPGYGKRI